MSMGLQVAKAQEVIAKATQLLPGSSSSSQKRHNRARPGGGWQERLGDRLHRASSCCNKQTSSGDCVNNSLAAAAAAIFGINLNGILKLLSVCARVCVWKYNTYVALQLSAPTASQQEGSKRAERKITEFDFHSLYPVIKSSHICGYISVGCECFEVNLQGITWSAAHAVRLPRRACCTLCQLS